MLSSSLLTLVSSIALTAATALPMHIRAGGPAAKPFPAACTLTSLTPAGEAQSVPGTSSGTFAGSYDAAFGPSTDFRGAHTTYSYFQEDLSAEDGWDESAKIQQCLEQCHGFGGPCTSVAWGHNVWGTTFGHEVTNEVGCLFLDTKLESADLAPVTNGSWTKAVVVNIDCPEGQ